MPVNPSAPPSGTLPQVLLHPTLHALVTTIFAYQLLFDLIFRALVIQCGDWYARTTTVAVLVPLTGLGALATLKCPPRSIHRLIALLAVGFFGFMNMQGVVERVAGAIFSTDIAGDLSDVQVWKRCVFVGVGAGWVAGVSLGYALWSYVREVGESCRSKVSGAQLVGWFSAIQCVCVGLFLYDVPMQMVALPYPDCTVPLVGVGMVGAGILSEFRGASSTLEASLSRLRMPASVVIAVGLSYAFNAYLRCGYCGGVEGRVGALSSGELDSRVVVVWKCPLQSGGVLQVVDVDVVMEDEKDEKDEKDERASDNNSDRDIHRRGEAYRLRAVRLGHAIMGGVWTAPPEVAGMPIFSAFHLQAATGAIFVDNSNPVSSVGRRSLHVGLGIGGSVTLLQNLGYTSDCVELHPEMAQVAKEFFRLNGTACQIGDANELLVESATAGGSLPLDAYDVIIVDIFSGDADAVASKELFSTISRSSMKATAKRKQHAQVLVVNYFGLQGHKLYALYESIRQSFVTVHIYREEAQDARISNFVIIARNGGSGSPLAAADPVDPGRLRTSPYSEVFADYTEHLIEVLDRREIVPTSTCGEVMNVLQLLSHRLCKLKESLAFAGAHWRAMRTQFDI